MAVILVIDKLRNAILSICSMARLVSKLRRRTVNTFKTIIIVHVLLQELEFIHLRGNKSVHLRVVHYILLRGEQEVCIEILSHDAISQLNMTRLVRHRLFRSL